MEVVDTACFQISTTGGSPNLNLVDDGSCKVALCLWKWLLWAKLHARPCSFLHQLYAEVGFCGLGTMPTTQLPRALGVAQGFLLNISPCLGLLPPISMVFSYIWPGIQFSFLGTLFCKTRVS